MWCANCQADVAAEVSPVDGRVQCAVCSTELARARGIGEKTRDAREILERWSKTDLSDPFGPLPAIRKPERIMDPRPENDGSKDNENPAADHGSADHRDVEKAKSETQEIQDNAPDSKARRVDDAEIDSAHIDAERTDTKRPDAKRPKVKRPDRRRSETKRVRIDATDDNRVESDVDAGAEEFEKLTSNRPTKPRAKPKFRIDSAVPSGAVGGARSTRPRTRRPARDLRFDEPHGRAVPPPHYEYTLREPEPKDNWSVAAGQWLAYIGVLALTIGTAIVVYGHFGGYSNYTPTGWLITTVGQMLLFLGVINLVSGGMEQSNDEVSQRIEMLGEHILRIEQATDHALRGPKIPAAVYDGEEAVSERESQENYLSE